MRKDETARLTPSTRHIEATPGGAQRDMHAALVEKHLGIFRSGEIQPFLGLDVPVVFDGADVRIGVERYFVVVVESGEPLVRDVNSPFRKDVNLQQRNQDRLFPLRFPSSAALSKANPWKTQA